MAKKTKKQFKSNLKLEALEQRQLLAGIVGGNGIEVQSNASSGQANNSNVYDQVLMTGSSVAVKADAGQVTRVSFLDLQGDIVQAEFSGGGTLNVSLAGAVLGQQPAKYVQTVSGVVSGVAYSGYAQGLASFTIQDSDATTNLTIFSVGSGNAVNTALFDTGHTGGDHIANVARITVVANTGAPNGSAMGGIFAGDAVFGADNGVVGISAANVQVQNTVTIGDIKATGTATPTLVFGTFSQFGAVTIAGGGLVEANGASIANAGSYKYGLTFAAGADSSAPAGTSNLPVQTAPAGLSWTGDNPLAAQVKTFTLTTSVDTVVASGGNDTINGLIGGVSATLTPLDTIDGGAGTDSLSVNDVAGTSALPIGISIKNVETLNLGAAGGVGTALAPFDTSSATITGLTTLNVLASAGNDFIKAGTGQAVTVFDNSGTVNLAGGSTQTVTTAGGVVLSKATGEIKVTDLNQAGAASTINDGTTVTITTSSDLTGVGAAGSLIIGGTTKPTGAVTVTAKPTGESNPNAGGATDRTAGAITVNGGTTVQVTQTASSPIASGAGTNRTLTEGNVTVNGGAGVTTSVTVSQAPSLAVSNNTTANPDATEVDVVTFSNLSAGQAVKVDGLTYVAPTGGANASDVAKAFSNLSNGALSNWTTGAVSGASSNQVTFTATGRGTDGVVGHSIIPASANNALVDTVVFGAVGANKTLTILGRTYDDSVNNVAAGGAGNGTGITAAQAAAYFASQVNLSTGAGIFWNSAAPSGTGLTTVVFSATTAGVNDVKIVPTGTVAGAEIPAVTEAVPVSVNALVSGLKSGGGNGRAGMAQAGVTILDGNYGTGTNTIATVSLTNYDTSTISSNALSTLSLTSTANKDDGSATGTLTINNTVATSLDLTLNGNPGGGKKFGDITNNTYTTLKVHTTGNDSSVKFVDSALTTLTVDGSKKLSLDASSLGSLTTVTVTGTASLSSSNLTGAALTDVNASGTTGSASVTINPTTATFEGGSGNDNVTITVAPTKVISGGSGTDTLTLNGVGAGTFGNPSSNTNITGFETLAIGSAGSGSFDATGFTDLRRASDGGDVAFTNVGAGTTLTFTDNATNNTSYTLKTDTSADALTLTVNKNAKTVTAGDVETVAISNGSNDSTLTLTAAKATTITVTGGKALNLTSSSAGALTMVDASGASGSLTYTTTGTTMTVKGGSANDTLTAFAGGNSNDVLIGGGGNDTLTANKGINTLTGGSGNDTFVIASPGVDLTVYSAITDASVGDVIRMKDQGTEVYKGEVSAQTTASFHDLLDKAVKDGGNGSTNGVISWFKYNNDVYVVESLHDGGATPTFQNNVDIVVRLQGVANLDSAAFLMNGASPEIVIR